MDRDCMLEAVQIPYDKMDDPETTACADLPTKYSNSTFHNGLGSTWSTTISASRPRSTFSGASRHGWTESAPLSLASRPKDGRCSHLATTKLSKESPFYVLVPKCKRLCDASLRNQHSPSLFLDGEARQMYSISKFEVQDAASGVAEKAGLTRCLGPRRLIVQPSS
ncbi:hypothetical protein M011DRAFT_275768 [Sporormia fimetaria CBS 119925]|uniref:Uncharacterized protein n=1 Tax=Sporormia fimetaria CBS 119925 TaxID=1340428 RepID=A0A6A6VKL9_9PLEO|nr:hypothetical protein M011DRAFT_275768 [Sporormia fimetaria CBS 119925]